MIELLGVRRDVAVYVDRTPAHGGRAHRKQEVHADRLHTGKGGDARLELAVEDRRELR